MLDEDDRLRFWALRVFAVDDGGEILDDRFVGVSIHERRCSEVGLRD